MVNRSENLKKVKDRVAKAALAAGRDPNEITLLAVSKVFKVEDLKEVYDLGQIYFGESRPQELRDKAPLLPSDIHWHFIGTLQVNKIKYVVPNAKLIHAVDSVKLARSIAAFGQKRNIVPNILLEINTSGEEAKHGFMTDESVEKVLEISTINNLHISGLMTMAPYTDDESKVRSSFIKLRNIKEEINKHLDSDDFNTLSMGMSGDFELAIDEGSTIVRIGTAIFGQRIK